MKLLVVFFLNYDWSTKDGLHGLRIWDRGIPLWSVLLDVVKQDFTVCH